MKIYVVQWLDPAGSGGVEQEIGAFRTKEAASAAIPDLDAGCAYSVVELELPDEVSSRPVDNQSSGARQ